MTRFKVKFAMTDDRTGVTDEDIGDHITSSINNSSVIMTSVSFSAFPMCPSSTLREQHPTSLPTSDSSLLSQFPSDFLIADNYYCCNNNNSNSSSVVVRRKALQFPLSTTPSFGVDADKDRIMITQQQFIGNTTSSRSWSSSLNRNNNSNFHHQQSGRDNPVMESCQSRTLIIDTDNDNRKVKNSSPCASPIKNVNTISSSSFCCSPNSNYNADTITSCTPGLLTTTKNASTIIIALLMTMVMAATATLVATVRCWKHTLHNRRCRCNHYSNHYHHHQKSNCLQKAGGTFISSVIVFLLTVNCTRMVTLVHGQPPPLPPAGFLDFDNLPVTRFSCEGKVIGGYYADVETGCQMFHVCTLGQKDEIQDIKFLCLNGTVFDQETRVCERVDEVDCSKAEQFFDLNLDLYVPHATTQKPEEDADLEEEDDIIRPVQSKPKSPSSTTTTTTRATTTTTTPTPSPRTRPPTPPSSPRTRAPVISSSSSQQVEDEDEEEEDDANGNNAYTSFNYFLKTPHSHVASGYNSQSRQSYIINQPAGPSRSSNGGSSSSTTSSSSSGGSSTGRKVPSGPGPKTIVYTSSSVSSSTARPKTVVVVKATLPPSKSILKPKTLPAPRTTTTTTTPVPPPKYELDDQYDEYYDDEDYTVEQQQAPPPSSKGSSTAYAQYPPPPAKTALISSTGSSSRDSYNFRDARYSKGIANAGQTIISTGSSSSSKSSSGSKVSASSSSGGSKPSSVPTAGIKVISSEFIGNNSTEEPYYYEDDYPDDITLQQQEQLRHSALYSASTPSSRNQKGSVPSSSSPSSNGRVRGTTESTSSKSKSVSASGRSAGRDSKESSASAADADYYDEDTGVTVNAHDHHFTHVDVPRIPYAKPNVPRVLVTNGKPFLPRLRRQSHHHLYYTSGVSSRQQADENTSPNHPFVLPASSSKPVQTFSKGRSLPLFANSHHPGDGRSSSKSKTASEELRQEARLKAREWGRDRNR